MHTAAAAAAPLAISLDEAHVAADAAGIDDDAASFSFSFP